VARPEKMGRTESNQDEVEIANRVYYDTISEQDLDEETEWAENVGPNLLDAIDE